MASFLCALHGYALGSEIVFSTKTWPEIYVSAASHAFWFYPCNVLTPGVLNVNCLPNY